MVKYTVEIYKKMRFTCVIVCIIINLWIVNGFHSIFANRLRREVKIYGDNSKSFERGDISKTFDSFFESETFAFNEFNPNTTLYTIVSSQSLRVTELLKNMKIHNKNFVFVDIKYFTENEFKKFVTEILPPSVMEMVGDSSVSIETIVFKPVVEYSQVEFDKKMRLLRNSTFVFENEYDYIGGIFEMYERLLQDDESDELKKHEFIIDETRDGGDFIVI